MTITPYKGEARYRKHRVIKGKTTPAALEEQISVVVPAIVDTATWEIAHHKCEWNRQKVQRNRPRGYLLTGFIWCDACNTRAFGNFFKDGEYIYYICAARDNPRYYARTCHTPAFRCEPIEASVWTWIESLVTNADVRATTLHVQHVRWNEQAAPLRAQLTEIDAQVQTLEMQAERLLDLYLTSALAKRTWSRRHEPLQRQLHQLRDEQTKVQGEIKKYTLNEELLQEIHRQALQLLARVHAEEHTFDLKRKLFALLDLNVRLCLDVQANHYVKVQCVFGEEKFMMPNSYKSRRKKSSE